MRKLTTLLILLVFTAFSLDKYSVPFSASDSMTAAQYNSNNDTAAAYHNQVVDTLNKNVPRYSQNVYTHDLVMPYLNLDTIRSGPDIDTIIGNPYIDSVETPVLQAGLSWLTTVNVDYIRSNPDIDSISGNPFVDTITTNSINTDSINFGKKGVFYDSGSVACTLSNALGNIYFYGTLDTIGTLHWYRFGNFIGMKISDVTFSCSTSIDQGLIQILNFPSELLTTEDQHAPLSVPIRSDDTYLSALIKSTYAAISFWRTGNTASMIFADVSWMYILL
jgi:hypothetical protein